MKTVKAKQLILTSKSTDWFGAKYGVNIYRGCNFGCIYCDSRSTVYNVGNFDEVKIKENYLELFEKELKSKRITGIINLGAMSDHYNTFEKDEHATRNILKLINKYKFGVNITTKSNLVLRDIDILKKINKHSEVLVSLTITTIDDRLRKLIEPHSSSTPERFMALKTLAENDIYTGITLMPLIPYLNDTLENVLGIVEEAKKANVKFIFAGFGVTQREGQMEYMYAKFDEHFPGLKDKFISEFKGSYGCGRKSNIHDEFKKKCKEYNIETTMKKIMSGAQKYVTEKQVSLF